MRTVCRDLRVWTHLLVWPVTLASDTGDLIRCGVYGGSAQRHHLSEQVMARIDRGRREQDPANTEPDLAGDLQQRHADRSVLA